MKRVQEKNDLPWYETTVRWGQTNLTEIDPRRYDHNLWTEQWAKTDIQGVIINAGGIIAYYPSEIPLHFRSPYLDNRDLFGEIVEKARERNLTVIARMDCNRAEDRFYQEHPDWFCIDAEGVPYRAAGRFIACINSPYYDEYIPQVLREIISKYSPDGFADNSWSGLTRDRICYCQYCSSKFKRAYGSELPREHDWSDPVYRKWIQWNYDLRVHVWDLFNSVTTESGGHDCLWIGMNSALVEHQSARFRDLARICDRTPFVFMDHQYRRISLGFQENAYAGKLVLGIKDWNGLAAESMAMYNYSNPPFRVGSMPEQEARMWMVEGFAGTIQPWWHHIGAKHLDRRQYDTAPPLFKWHASHEDYLRNRRPIANIGVLWSQENTDFYGRDDPEARTQQPHFGIISSLVRAGLTYVPVNRSQLAGDLEGIDVLVLPAIGALCDADCESIAEFVRNGGGLVATGETSLYTEEGEPRENFGLADVFGAKAKHRSLGSVRHPKTSWETSPTHSYLDIPARWDIAAEERHPVLHAFENTDQLPFGGRIECVEITDGQPLLNFVAPFPAYPPETSWQRHPASGVPGLIVREEKGRVAYFPADIDRCFGRDLQPDHAQLLANAVLWAAKGRTAVRVKGVGTVDCHLYWHDSQSYVLHLVNLSAAGAWRGPMHEQIPIGPLDVEIDAKAVPVHLRTTTVDNSGFSASAVAESAQLLVQGSEISVRSDGEHIKFTVPKVIDHEVVVVSV